MSKEWRDIPASVASMRTINPIRAITDQLKPPSIPEKPVIYLSIGDPTIEGNLKTHEFVNNALINSVNSFKFNGYAHSAGMPHVRQALANYFNNPDFPITSEDVILTSGCSSALEMAFTVLANEGDNVLIPCPGFSLYETICGHRGIEQKFYRLSPENDWEADTDHMESLINEKTRAIVINNPSNPCGSVYSREHLLEIVAVAEKHKLPIIADEIYGFLTYNDHKFIPIESVSSTVPVLTVGGIAKSYLVPGWRLGWIIINDRFELFKRVRTGLLRLSTLILGPNTLIQSIIPEILNNIPAEYFKDLNYCLEKHSQFLYSTLKELPGLVPIRPNGAMYMMVKIELGQFEDITGDIDFSQKLLREECVFVLPGSIFHLDNFIRIFLCPPLDVLTTACDRIQQFCNRHRLVRNPSNHS
eukprot:TRINITY_DN8159_c0_g1_i1.p1 TRINITY_DN8159_c0_g1~~TRINITY_DN8159_c0_g1_i1.p1  ORF type:complete len:447 (+),score=45.42 TRINITY_DN8159_c0_g1_i1:95-1342(+)